MRVASVLERSWVYRDDIFAMNLRWNHPLSIMAWLDEMIISAQVYIFIKKNLLYSFSQVDCCTPAGCKDYTRFLVLDWRLVMLAKGPPLTHEVRLYSLDRFSLSGTWLVEWMQLDFGPNYPVTWCSCVGHNLHKGVQLPGLDIHWLSDKTQLPLLLAFVVIPEQQSLLH